MCCPAGSQITVRTYLAILLKQNIQTFSRISSSFCHFAWCVEVDTPSDRVKPKGHVTQQHGNDTLEQNDEWKQQWLHVDWISSESPWIHQSTKRKAKEKWPLRAEEKVGGWLLCYLKSSWLVVESARLWFHATFSPEASDLRQLTVHSSPG